MEMTSSKQKEQRKKKWLKSMNRGKKSIVKLNRKKKFVRKFSMYKKNSNYSSTTKKSTHEFKYYSSTVSEKSFCSNGNREFEEMKKGCSNRWKSFTNIDTTTLNPKRSEIKNLFRKSKNKNKNQSDKLICDNGDDDVDDDDVWSTSWTINKPKKYFTISRTNVTSNENDNFICKTSKLSLPLTLSDKSKKKYNNNNNNNNCKLLWRSLEHVQKLYEDNYLDEISKIINVKFDDAPDNNNKNLRVITTTDYKSFENLQSGKKARLSRWNFLRHDNNNNNHNQTLSSSTSSSSSNDKTVKRRDKSKLNYAKFFTRKKNNDKKISKKINSECDNGGGVRGSVCDDDDDYYYEYYYYHHDDHNGKNIKDYCRFDDFNYNFSSDDSDDDGSRCSCEMCAYDSTETSINSLNQSR